MGRGSHRAGNINPFNLAGVLMYLHYDVVWRLGRVFLDGCNVLGTSCPIRRQPDGVDRIVRLLVTVHNPAARQQLDSMGGSLGVRVF